MKPFDTRAPERVSNEPPKQEDATTPHVAEAKPSSLPPDEAALSNFEEPTPKPQVRDTEAKPTAMPQIKPEPNRGRVAASRGSTRKNARQRSQEENPARIASTAASGVGRGRSDLESNYRGLVAAHLARYKQFPSDARARGSQGSTSVSFTIDGSGRVTSVQLALSSGIASLDQETTAMVRRASPFPAPPGGYPMRFSMPVNFSLR